MASNINPSLTPVNNLTNFKFWCQKVLPLVYDDSLSYYEVLGKMVVQLNDVIDNVNADTENVLTLKDAFLELQTYVNNFFDDIDQLASYAERAEAAQTAANTSAVNAATSASNASASSLAAMDARDTAVAARQATQASANTASTAATNANTKANEAAQSAITAQTAQASASQSATLAATDRSAAQTAASTATTKASEASTSATNAETSANNAAQSKEDAEEAANNIQENLDNIQKNTQDISDLKESITQNSNNNINGYEKYYYDIIDGEYPSENGFVQNANWWRSDYIPIRETKVLYYTNDGTTAYNAFYDENKTFIKQFPIGAHSEITKMREEVFPANAKYLIISNVHENDMDIFYSSSDATLTLSNVPAEAKTTGDILTEIKNGKSKYITIDGSYWNLTGKAVPYAGWSRTDFIPCNPNDILYINSPVNSTYNIFFNTATEQDMVGIFTISQGDNVITVPSNAHFYALSNTTEGLKATTYRVLPTYEEFTSALSTNDIITLNPKETVGQAIIQSAKKLNPWHISPTPTVQDVVTFGVLTDMHGDGANLARFLKYCAEYSTYINGGLISLGDMVINIYSDDYSYWLNTSGADEIMLTIGNHDVWITNSVSSELAPKADAYTKYFEPNASKWGITQPTDAASQGLMYWYKDYPNSKLRIIDLDCMYWDSDENTWFTSVLSDAITKGYHVLCMQHYDITKDMTALDGNFNSLDYGFSHLVQSSGATDMKNAVDAFITNGGTFVGWLGGDAHFDAFGSFTIGNNKQASFVFECAGRNAGYTDSNRIVGQKSQDCFNIVSVDTYSKLLKIVRVGNNSDRYLRHKNYLTYDYDNGLVIAKG